MSHENFSYKGFYFGIGYSWEFVGNFIINNTARIQLKILELKFRLTSSAIFHAN